MVVVVVLVKHPLLEALEEQEASQDLEDRPLPPMQIVVVAVVVPLLDLAGSKGKQWICVGDKPVGCRRD